MAQANGEIPLSGDPRVDAAHKRIRGKFQDLEDAMVVQAHLERPQSDQIRSHAEWLAEQQEAISRHERWLERHELAMQRHDIAIQEIDGKLNLLIDREMRREGGPEAPR